MFDYTFNNCSAIGYIGGIMSWQDYLDSEYAISPLEGPFYTDFLVNVQEDYPNIGLASCDWSNTETPKLYIIKDILIEHFNFIYKYREIGAETESRWQYTVKRVFENIKRLYEHALSIYNDNDIKHLGIMYHDSTSVLGTSANEGWTRDDSTTTKTGTDTVKNTYNDTPVQALISSNNYASAINDNETIYGTTNTNGSEGSHRNDSTFNNTITKDGYNADKSNIEMANENIKYFRDLIDDFVNEFGVCFISTLGRV